MWLIDPDNAVIYEWVRLNITADSVPVVVKDFRENTELSVENMPVHDSP